MNLKVNELKQLLREILMKQDDIVFAYLFGSFATGRIHKFSDIDIAVFLKEYNIKIYKKIFSDLAINLPTEIDLIILNKAPPLLRHKVIKEGFLLFSRDENARIRFIEKTLIQALDFRETYNWLIKAKGDMLRAGRQNS